LSSPRSLVVEKETKIKETMKIMGLSSVAFNLSWFLTLILQTAIMVLLMTLAGKRSVFQFSNTGLIFIFLLAFALALVCFCFLVRCAMDMLPV
jgi:ATP-binding cassette, subfamily A (ABC1), member 3